MKKSVIAFPERKIDLDQQLRQAIASKRLIQFSYDGAVRIAEPHDYGRKNGTDKVLAYQRRKVGQRGKPVTGWRWLETTKIEDCSVLEDTFPGTREGAAQHHHAWDVLYARVE